MSLCFVQKPKIRIFAFAKLQVTKIILQQLSSYVIFNNISTLLQKFD